MEVVLNPKCVSCKTYWKPDVNDVKSSGATCKTCKRCREKNDINAERKRQEKNEYQKQYRKDHNEQVKEYNKNYNQDHKEQAKEYQSQYNKDNNNKEKKKEYNNKYRQDNKDAKREYNNQYRLNIKQNNPAQYLVQLQYAQISRCLKKSTTTERKPIIEYLGCSPDELLNYIQIKINNWNADNLNQLMDLTNIQIDHTKPISRFNLDDPDEFLECVNYTNLQPLLIADNKSKYNRWTDENEAYWVDNIRGNTEYNKVYL